MQNLKAFQRQTEAYWIVDGIVDILIGATFLGLVLFEVLACYKPLHPTNWWRVVEVIYLFGMVFASKWIAERLKWRLTYPRTGYVSYRSERSKGAWLLTIGVGLAFLLAVIFLSSRESLLVAIESVFVAAVALYSCLRYRSIRYGVYSVVSLLSGVASVYLLERAGTRSPLLLSGMGVLAPVGVVMLFGGAWALLGYLKSHPKEENGGAA